MSGNRYTFFAAIAVLVVAILFLIVLLRPSGESQARETVESFGLALREVSLLSPDAASRMAKFYAPYVDPGLLAAWEADPSHAPGRTTSSPYPARIEVISVAQQGAGYVILGDIVEMTSTGEAGRHPVIMQVVPEDGGYRIVAYQQQAQ